MRSYYLHIIKFKPDRFLVGGSFESDLVETKLFFKGKNTTYGSDRPLEPSEGTITDDTPSTAYRKYLGVHTVLNAPLSSPMGER
jgi:hypothetical protein